MMRIFLCFFVVAVIFSTYANTLLLTCQDKRTHGYQIRYDECSVNSVKFLSSDPEVEVGPSPYLEKIKSLDVSGSQIEVLPAKLLTVFPYLNELKLVFNCQFVSNKLDKNLLLHMTPLEKLDISFSELNEIEEGVFQKLFKLKSLRLNTNQLAIIPENSFQFNSELRLVDLSGNKLKQIPANIFKFNGKLEEINYQNNQLEELSNEVFINNPELRNINLSGNQLRRIPATIFKNLNKLEFLDLSKNTCVDKLFTSSPSFDANTLTSNLKQC